MTIRAERPITLKYPATCRRCGMALPAGSRALWDPSAKSAVCAECPGADPFAAVMPPASGTAGRSAAVEGERRADAREQRIRTRFPRAGGLILAITRPPQTTTSWEVGAVGERAVAKALTEAQNAGTIIVLHDRRIPGSKANIDHLVVGPAGVYVVDTKRYVGKRIERRGRSLFVGGRRQDGLVEGVARQVDVVRRALDGLGSSMRITVTPVLCFVDGEWGLFEGPFDVGGVRVTYPRALVKLVTASGALDLDDRLVIGHHLARSLPEA